jgi:hypothetical protein
MLSSVRLRTRSSSRVAASRGMGDHAGTVGEVLDKGNRKRWITACLFCSAFGQVVAKDARRMLCWLDQLKVVP